MSRFLQNWEQYYYSVSIHARALETRWLIMSVSGCFNEQTDIVLASVYQCNGVVVGHLLISPLPPSHPSSELRYYNSDAVNERLAVMPICRAVF